MCNTNMEAAYFYLHFISYQERFLGRGNKNKSATEYLARKKHSFESIAQAGGHQG